MIHLQIQHPIHKHNNPIHPIPILPYFPIHIPKHLIQVMANRHKLQLMIRILSNVYTIYNIILSYLFLDVVEQGAWVEELGWQG